MVNQVKAQVDKVGTNHVIEEIKTRIYEEQEQNLKKALEDRVVELVEGQTPVIVAKLKDSIQSESAVVVASPADTVPSTGEEVRPPRADGLYYVVAGSSPVKKDLEREWDSVKNKVGREFEDLFPNVAIYPPLGRNTNFALVVDGNLPRAEAAELKQRAMEYGFRDDTFLWNANAVNFKTTSD